MSDTTNAAVLVAGNLESVWKEGRPLRRSEVERIAEHGNDASADLVAHKCYMHLLQNC